MSINEKMSTTKAKETLATKRQATLFRKAHQLSILCDAEVAITSFTKDGKLHEFSSTTMEQTLSRYKGNNPEELCRRHELKPSDQNRILDKLKQQHATLSLEKSRRMGRVLEVLNKEELCALEEQQLRALLAVNNKKRELIMGRLHGSTSAMPSHNDEQRGLQEKNLLLGFEGSSMMVIDRSSVVEDEEHSELLRLRL